MNQVQTGIQMFDEIVERVTLADRRASESTMMGLPCLRVSEGFAASVDRATGDLIVKLPATRVTAMIDSGEGLPFSPGGPQFKEWVRITDRDVARWDDLVEEAVAFVAP